MAERGTPVTRLVTDGTAASAAASSAARVEGEAGKDDGSGDAEEAVADPRRPWRGTKPAIEPLSGITDEQAQRIRDAVRERKRKRRVEGQ